MTIIAVNINKQAIDVDSEVEELTFKDLSLKESHLEEFLRKNIGQLFGDEESLLIVGQQVIDQEGSRSDLVAVDGDGCLVLIEVKRDLLDIKSRSEALESQAIRYAASLAKITDPRDLVRKMFASYISKHKNEEPFKSKLSGLSEHELATREINIFLKQNNIGTEFNKKQRIILISSEFDNITCSSSAWLIRNGVDLSCYQLRPMKIKGNHVIDFTRILPVEKDEDFFIDIHASSDETAPTISESKRIKRTSLPRMATLFDWNLIQAGDHLELKGFEKSDATVIDHKTVRFNDKVLSFNLWGQIVTGWSSICIYEWAILKKSGKTLHALRAQKMQELESEANAA